VTRLLIVEDEDAIRDSLAYSLHADGFEVEAAENGAGALEAIDAGEYDLVILDLMLGDMSGVEICRRVRAAGDVPILMLTARDEESDVVIGFEAGADDYVTKPFSMLELISRIRAILRRRDLDRGSGQRLRVAGDVEIDLLRHEAHVGGRPAQLTPTELRLLSLLASEDRAFTRRELLEHAWETTFVPDERSCDVHIANLRRKIEDDPTEPTRVLTVRGVGYRLDRNVQVPSRNL
jgi:two-component system, OmpR family, response regulator RegX3